jgi:hypothetical protein
LLLPSACQPTAQMPNLAPPSFAQMTPINLDVANIEVIDEYTPPMKAPNVEQFFAVTPEEAVHLWVRDRLRAVGSARTLQVIVKDASVVEKSLPRTQGVKGAFTNDQAQQYDARLEVEMRIYSDRAISDASINVVATRTRTIAENASVAEREKLFHDMLNELMASLNAELEKNIYQYFGNYISYAPQM